MPRRSELGKMGASRLVVASMRPRCDAAEYLLEHPQRADRAVASMRPWRDAAENDQVLAGRGAVQGASMRPRRDAAESFLEYTTVAGGPTLQFGRGVMPRRAVLSDTDAGWYLMFQ